MTTKSFSELRKQSTNIEKIAKQLKDSTSKKNYDDSRFWKAQLDKAGNGAADIRFLPAPQDEENTFVQYWDHFYKGPGGHYVENCPTTLGNPCPMCEDNTRHWKEGKEGEDFVRGRGSKRQLHYISNVLVLRDHANPENEGKVFLFKYGSKLHEKYMNAIIPKFEGDEGYLPYDLWKGANFKLRISKVAGYSNFDASVFDGRSAIKGTEEELEAIWQSEHSLKEFVDPTKFKAYDVLHSKLAKVLSGSSAAPKTIEETLNQVTAPQPSRTVSAPKTRAATAPSTRGTEIETLESLSSDSDDIESLKQLLADEE